MVKRTRGLCRWCCVYLMRQFVDFKNQNKFVPFNNFVWYAQPYLSQIQILLTQTRIFPADVFHHIECTTMHVRISDTCNMCFPVFSFLKEGKNKKWNAIGNTKILLRSVGRRQQQVSPRGRKLHNKRIINIQKSRESESKTLGGLPSFVWKH